MPGPSCAPGVPLRLRSGDVKTSLIGWGVYMALLTVYCTMYEVVIHDDPADLRGSFLWVLREWAVWWFITPLALKALRHYESRPETRAAAACLRVGAAVLLVSVAFRTAVDFLTADQGAGAILVIYTPRYLAVVVALLLIWHFFLRRREPAAQRDAGPSGEPAAVGHNGMEYRGPAAGHGTAGARPGVGQVERHNGAAPGRYPATLLVSKGRDTCPIRVERIECVSAAGNYVEIHSGNQLYLMRATMRKLEALLPPSRFVRVHRSHIVNLNEIDRIRSRPSGNGTVLLRSGKAVSISKRYRSRLQNTP